jgi:starvation-inducible DNA-binding protein
MPADHLQHSWPLGAEPKPHQHASEIQVYGTVTPALPLGLSVEVREEVVERLNQILADSVTIRDLYKKCHWQVTGPAFYQFHHLFDKHSEAQSDLVDVIAERIRALGGVSLAMAFDVAETASIPRPPRWREQPPVQISRQLEANAAIILEVRAGARRAAELGDDSTTDLLVGEVLGSNEQQVWFLSEHLVDLPLTLAY